MKNIKINEYVKLVDGVIRKVKSIENHYINVDKEYYNRQYRTMYDCTFDERVLKHSKKIFELLDNEDFVILEYYVKKYAKRITRKFEVYKIGNTLIFENRHCDFHYDLVQSKWWNDAKGFNPKIKKVVTKESFKTSEYDV